jgi:hypothetical protein
MAGRPVLGFQQIFQQVQIERLAEVIIATGRRSSSPERTATESCARFRDLPPAAASRHGLHLLEVIIDDEHMNCALG